MKNNADNGSHNGITTSLNEKKGSVVKHTIGFFLLAAVIGSLSFYPSTSIGTSWLLNILQLVLFVATGILYHQFFLNSLVNEDSPNQNQRIYVSIIFAVAICVSLLLLGYLFKILGYLNIAACGCAFILPVLIMESWLTFNDTSEEKPKTWLYFENVHDNRVTIFLNSIPVKIRLRPRYLNAQEEVFEATFPGHVKLGFLFNRFICDENEDREEKIELFDKTLSAYGWNFYAEKLGGLQRRNIDPELSLRDNKIAPNSTILALRVVQPKRLEYSAGVDS